MQDYGQLQLASGSTLTQQQIDGFLLLIRHLALYRNRNSRNIGEQFRSVPGEFVVKSTRSESLSCWNRNRRSKKMAVTEGKELNEHLEAVS